MSTRGRTPPKSGAVQRWTDSALKILDAVSLNRLLGDVTLVVEKRKPFDELAKRPQIQLSRGDKTAIELFRQGLDGWDAGLRRRMDNGNHKQD